MGANNAKDNRNNSNRNQQPQPIQSWKEESDSPIEQSKMHPLIKKYLIGLLGFDILVKIIWLLYLFGIWQMTDGIFDTLAIGAGFLLNLIAIPFIKIQKTQKVREDE